MRRFWESAFKAGDNGVSEIGGGCISGSCQCSPVWSNSVPKELSRSPIAVEKSASIDRIFLAHLIRFNECNEYKLRGEKADKRTTLLSSEGADSKSGDWVSLLFNADISEGYPI